MRDRRIVRVRIAGEERFVAVEDAARYRDALGVVLERGLPAAFLGPTTDALTTLVARYARTHGPFTAGDDRGALGPRRGVGRRRRSSASSRTARWSPARSCRRRSRHAHAGARPARRSSTATPRCSASSSGRRSRGSASRSSPSRPTSSRASSPTGRASSRRTTRARSGSRGARSSALLRAIAQLEGCPDPGVGARDGGPPRTRARVSPVHARSAARHAARWCGQASSRSARTTDASRSIAPIASRSSRRRPAASTRLRRRSTTTLRELFEKRGALFFAEIKRNVPTYPQEVLGALWDSRLGRRAHERHARAASHAAHLGRARGAARPPAAPPRESRARGQRGSLVAPPLAVGARPVEHRARDGDRTRDARALRRRAARGARMPRGCPAGSRTSTTCIARSRIRGACDAATSSRSAARRSSRCPAPRSASARSAPTTRSARTLVLGATDPANPWGSLLPWPREAREAVGRRAPRRRDRGPGRAARRSAFRERA